MYNKFNHMTNKRKVISLFAALLTAISAAGCNTLNIPSSSNEIWVPPKNIKTSDSKDPVWSSIRGLDIDRSKPLALADLVDIALRNNPSTKQAWARTRVEEAKKKQEESKFYPDVTVGGKATREKTVANIEMADANNTKYGPSLKVTYLLLDFGGRAASVEEMSESLVAANYQLNRTIQDVVLDAEKAYYGLYSARSSLEAAESDVKNARAAYDAASQRYEVGLAAKLDMLQAKAAYEQSLYALEGAKGAVKTAKAGLAKALGYPADAEFDIAEPAKELPKDISDEDITRIINDAIDQRPDIAAMRASLRSQKAAALAANSDLYPTLNAGASYSKNWYKYYSNAQPRDTDRSYAAYLSFDWNIFDGFENLNIFKEEEALARVEREKLIAAEIDASAQVWTKYYDFKTAIKKVEYSEAFLNTAQTSYELALESYSNGLKSILDLLDAESKLSDAKSGLIQSKEDLFIALAELAHATGTIYTGGENKNE